MTEDAGARPNLSQGDIITRGGQVYAIVSRTCDLPRTWPDTALIASVFETDDAHALRGWHPRLVPLPSSVSEVIDTSKTCWVAKTELPLQADRPGCETIAHERVLAHNLGQTLELPSLPDVVGTPVTAMWDELRKRLKNPALAAAIDGLLEIRGRFEPERLPGSDNAPERLTFVFIIDSAYPLPVGASDHDTANMCELAEAWRTATTADQQGAVLQGLCHALVRKADAIATFSIDIEVVNDVDFTYADMKRTDALRTEAMSQDP